MAEHTFITEWELFTYLGFYAWVVPLIMIGTFLVLYRLKLVSKIKAMIKKNQDLTKLEPHRSNGHHKKKEKV